MPDKKPEWSDYAYDDDSISKRLGIEKEDVRRLKSEASKKAKESTEGAKNLKNGIGIGGSIDLNDLKNSNLRIGLKIPGFGVQIDSNGSGAIDILNFIKIETVRIKCFYIQRFYFAGQFLYSDIQKVDSEECNEPEPEPEPDPEPDPEPEPPKLPKGNPLDIVCMIFDGFYTEDYSVVLGSSFGTPTFTEGSLKTYGSDYEFINPLKGIYKYNYHWESRYLEIPITHGGVVISEPITRNNHYITESSRMGYSTGQILQGYETVGASGFTLYGPRSEIEAIVSEVENWKEGKWKGGNCTLYNEDGSIYGVYETYERYTWKLVFIKEHIIKKGPTTQPPFRSDERKRKMDEDCCRIVKKMAKILAIDKFPLAFTPEGVERYANRMNERIENEPRVPIKIEDYIEFAFYKDLISQQAIKDIANSTGVKEFKKEEKQGNPLFIYFKYLNWLASNLGELAVDYTTWLSDIFPTLNLNVTNNSTDNSTDKKIDSIPKLLSEQNKLVEEIHRHLGIDEFKIEIGDKNPLGNPSFLYLKYLELLADGFFKEDLSFKDWLKKEPIPPGLKKDTSSLVKLLMKGEKITGQTYQTLGIDQFPASMPISLLAATSSKGEVAEQSQTTVSTFADLFGWYIDQFDKIMGQWSVDILIKDEDPLTPGDQSKRISLPNLAESICEIYGLLLQQNIATTTALNFESRILPEIGLTREATIKVFRAVETIVDYMGIEVIEKEEFVQHTFDPNGDKLDEILADIPPKAPIKIYEFDYKNGTTLQAALRELAIAANIIKGVFGRRLEGGDSTKLSPDDIKNQIRKNVKDMEKNERIVRKKSKEDWDGFKSEIESDPDNNFKIKDV